MKFGFPLSLILHTSVIFGGVIFLKASPLDLQEAKVVPVDLISVAEFNNLRENRKKPDPKPKPKETPAPAPNPSAASLPPKEVVKDIPKKPAPPAFNLGDFSALASQARAQDEKADDQTLLVSEANIGAQDQQGVGEQTGNTVKPQAYIASKLAGLWQINDGAADYTELLVIIRLHLDDKGNIMRIEVLNEAQIIASNNPAWRTARANAKTALRTAAPYNLLQGLDYEQWKTIKINMKPEI